jgi:hypothetical protein
MVQIARCLRCNRSSLLHSLESVTMGQSFSCANVCLCLCLTALPCLFLLVGNTACEADLGTCVWPSCINTFMDAAFV